MLNAKEQTLLNALEPRAAEEGVEIVTVEITGARKAPTIRIYIDTPQGVSFDELASAQNWINSVIDDIDPFPGAYQLEVSSPGIDRPLRTPEHFSRFADNTVVIKTRQPLNNRASWTGTLKGCENGVVSLMVDGVPVSIPLDTIKRAHLKGTVDFSS